MPLVVTDVEDSRASSSRGLLPCGDQLLRDDWRYVHDNGIPHRAVHIEITDHRGAFFVWERTDGRLEIPSGHVDWLSDCSRPESYEEAACREIVEELELGSASFWGTHSEALCRLQGCLTPVEKTVNQLPSSFLNNNEWVMVYGLRWRAEWPSLVDHMHRLTEEETDRAREGKAKSATWLSLQELKARSLEDPMAIHAALRLLLRRRGIMVPVLMTEYLRRHGEQLASINRAHKHRSAEEGEAGT